MPFLPLHDDNPRVFIGVPWVTWGLIAACVGVYALQATGSAREAGQMIYGFGLIPASLTGAGELHPELVRVPPWATLFTSQFLHAGLMHLIGNMLFLWVFGDNVEDSLGHARFLAFYLVCGLVAALAHTLADPSSQVPTIGASGAVSGVLGAYLLLHPKARVLVPIWIIPVYLPAFWLLIFWFVYQIVFAAMTETGGAGVAWWAHIGGFLAGLALVVPLRRRMVPLFGAGDPPRGLTISKGSWRRERPTAQGQDRRGPWS